MSKKGVSAEEKKSRMLELFYEKGECFQLKELEKLAPKSKGIIANAVKDVVQILVDDGLVDSDKIGTSVYYWAFPSKVIKGKKRKLDDATTLYQNSIKKLKYIEQSVEDSKVSNNNEDQHNKVLSEITDLELDIASLKKTIQEHNENDPAKFDAMSQKTKTIKDAANRWTDNVFAVKSWCKRKFMTEDKELDRHFGISEDFDYIE